MSAERFPPVNSKSFHYNSSKSKYNFSCALMSFSSTASHRRPNIRLLPLSVCSPFPRTCLRVGGSSIAETLHFSPAGCNAGELLRSQQGAETSTRPQQHMLRTKKKCSTVFLRCLCFKTRFSRLSVCVKVCFWRLSLLLTLLHIAIMCLTERKHGEIKVAVGKNKPNHALVKKSSHSPLSQGSINHPNG